jgi:hypothetical protein
MVLLVLDMSWRGVLYFYFPHVQDLADAYLADAWGTLLALEFAVAAAAAAAA